MDDDALVLAGYDALMGARGISRARRGAPRQNRLARMAADLPSASGRVMRQFFGLAAQTFVNGGATTLTVTDRPQRTIQIDRVVIARFNVGAASPNLGVTISRFRIGAEDMLSGNGAIPIEMFAANVTSGRFHGYTAKAGIDVTVTYVITAAPAAAETVTLTWGAFGDTVAG